MPATLDELITRGPPPLDLDALIERGAQTGKPGVYSRVKSKIDRGVMEFYNAFPAAILHTFGGPDIKTAEPYAWNAQQRRIKGRSERLSRNLLDDEYEDIVRQLYLPPAARESKDLRDLPQFTRQVNPFAVDIAPPKNLQEKIVSVGAGLGGKLAQIAVARKLLPSGTSEPAVWETANLASGGPIGEAAAMGGVFSWIKGIPAISKLGKATRLGAESAALGGMTAISGGDTEDIIISSLIPVAFAGYGAARGRTSDAKMVKQWREQLPFTRDIDYKTSLRMARAMRANWEVQQTKDPRLRDQQLRQGYKEYRPVVDDFLKKADIAFTTAYPQPEPTKPRPTIKGLITAPPIQGRLPAPPKAIKRPPIITEIPGKEKGIVGQELLYGAARPPQIEPVVAPGPLKPPKPTVTTLKEEIAAPAQIERPPEPPPEKPVIEPEAPKTLDELAEKPPDIRPEVAPIVELPVKNLQLSRDVPNFKQRASRQTGIIPEDRLQGKYERLGTGAIVVWERNNGRQEVITGRHRLDLAKRTGQPTIPAQVVKESEGFDKNMAMIIDAEANIRDAQGSVKDYASYFRNTELSEDDARAKGLLSRAKGNLGWDIGKSAGDDVFTKFINGQINEAKAAAIARGAPLNDRAQQLALMKSGEMSAEELQEFARMTTRLTPSDLAKPRQGNLFGYDESAIEEAEAIAKEVSKERASINDRILAVKGALKRPAQARKMGLEFSDEKAISAEVKRLETRLDDLTRVGTTPKLYREMMVRAGLKPKETLGAAITTPPGEIAAGTPIEKLIFRGVHPLGPEGKAPPRHRWWTGMPKYALQYAQGGEILVARQEDIPESYIQGEAGERGVTGEDFRNSLAKGYVGAELALAPFDEKEVIEPILRIDAVVFAEALKNGKVKTLGDLQKLAKSTTPPGKIAAGEVPVKAEGKQIPPRPLVNPKATALKQDKQLIAQQEWDRKYGSTQYHAELPPVEPAEEVVRRAEANFRTYQKNLPNATESQIVDMIIEDGLRPPREILERNDNLQSVKDLLADEKIEKQARLYGRQLRRAYLAKQAPAEAEGKQVWEKRQAEYARDMWQGELEQFRDRPDIFDAKNREEEIQHFRELHAGAVAAAIKQGKSVPANVLADYPALAKQAPAPQEYKRVGSFEGREVYEKSGKLYSFNAHRREYIEFNDRDYATYKQAPAPEGNMPTLINAATGQVIVNPPATFVQRRETQAKPVAKWLTKQVRYAGQVMTEQQYLDRLLQEGYVPTEEARQGLDKYRAEKGDDSYTLTSQEFAYLKESQISPAPEGKLAEIKQRLDQAYKKNDLKGFAAIIDKELAPLPSSFEKNTLQGMAQTLQMEMENRQAKTGSELNGVVYEIVYYEHPENKNIPGPIVHKERITVLKGGGKRAQEWGRSQAKEKGWRYMSANPVQPSRAAEHTKLTIEQVLAPEGKAVEGIVTRLQEIEQRIAFLSDAGRTKRGISTKYKQEIDGLRAERESLNFQRARGGPKQETPAPTLAEISMVYADAVPPTDVPTRVSLQQAVASALNEDAQKIINSKRKYKGLKNEEQLYHEQFANRPDLFIDTKNPIPEMRAAWTIATRGKGLFGGTFAPGFDRLTPIILDSVIASSKRLGRGGKNIQHLAGFYTGRAASVLEKHYGDEGKQMARGTREIDFQAARRYANQNKALETVLKPLSRKDRENLIRMGLGHKVDAKTKQRLAEVEQKVRYIMDSDMHAAAAVGYKRWVEAEWRDIQGSGKWSPQVLNDVGRQAIQELHQQGKGSPRIKAAIEQMVADGKAQSEDEAYAKLLDWSQKRVRGTHGYFEMTRVLLPESWLELDAGKILPPLLHKNAYMIEAARVWGLDKPEIEEQQQKMPWVGGEGEPTIQFTKAQALIKQIGLKYGSNHANALTKWLRTNFGLSNDLPSAVEDTLNALNHYLTITRLGLSIPSPIRNLTQGNVNLFSAPLSAHFGAINTQVMRRWSATAQRLYDEAYRAGAVLGRKEMAETQLLGGGREPISMRPFGMSEESNHYRAALIAARGAEQHIKDLAALKEGGTLRNLLIHLKYASINPERYLRELLQNRTFTNPITDAELDAILKRPLTLDEVQRIMHRAAVDTQFIRNLSTRPIPWKTNPWLGTALKFKTFGIDQTRIFWDEALKQAVKGTFAPLLKYLLFATIGGEVYNIARDLIVGADTSLTSTMINRPEKRTATDIAALLVNDFIDGAGIGIITDLTWGIGSFLGGPIGQTIQNLREAAANYQHPMMAARRFFRNELAVARQLDPLLSRADAMFFNENNDYFAHRRWRDRAYDFKTKAGYYTGRRTGLAPRVGKHVKEFFIGRPRYDMNLPYRYAADQVTIGDIDDAADYLAAHIKDNPQKDYKALHTAIDASMRAHAPFAGIADKDLPAFLNQFDAKTRSEGIALQRKWIINYQKAKKQAFEKARP